MEITLNRNEIVAWLKKASAISILSISLVGSLTELRTNISSPIKIASALSQNVPFLGDGPYLVKYEESADNNDHDLTYANFAVAFAFKARITEKNIFHGGYPQLLEALAEKEILSSITDQDGVLTAYILILLPTSPVELFELEKILESKSVFYAFPDGTGTLNENNVKPGEGIHLSC